MFKCIMMWGVWFADCVFLVHLSQGIISISFCWSWPEILAMVIGYCLTVTFFACFWVDDHLDSIHFLNYIKIIYCHV